MSSILKSIMARARNLPRNWNLEHSFVTVAVLALREIGAKQREINEYALCWARPIKF